MIKKILILIFTFTLIYSFFILSSCTQCSEDKNENKDSVVTDSEYEIPEKFRKTEQKIDPETLEEVNKNPEERTIHSKTVVQSKKTIDAGRLSEFLPDNVPGTEKIPSNNGIKDLGGYLVTTSSTEYVFPNRGFLTFAIFDYGNIEMLPKEDYRSFYILPDIGGSIVEKVRLDNAFGYKAWDETQRQGKMHLLFADRFILSIETLNLPKDYTSNLTEYLKYFNLKALINEAGKTKLKK